MDQNGKKEAFMAREFIIPGQIISGAGALDMAKNEISRQGKKALIVTDQVMIQLGNAKKLEEQTVFSVRGYGKFIFDQAGARTKKGRYQIKIKQYV